MSSVKYQNQVASVGVSDAGGKGNPWEPYFGPLANGAHLEMDPYRKRFEPIRNLPQAYQGRNYYLGEFMIRRFENQDTFYTQVILPFTTEMDQGTEARAITWNKTEFDSSSLDIVPEQTPATVLQTRREQYAAAFQRYGKELMFEHGFMETADGIASYKGQIRQLIKITQEMMNFDVVNALLNVNIDERVWNLRYGNIRQDVVGRALQVEKNRWAILQKTKHGLEKLDAAIGTEMQQIGADAADTWLLHRDVATYLNLVPAEKTDYYLAGQRGPNRVANYDSVSGALQLKRGTRVFLTRPFEVGVDSDMDYNVDPLLRERHIGEYFLLASAYQQDDNVEQYNSEEMSVNVYNEDQDKMSRVGAQAALRYGILFDEMGRMKDPVMNYDVPYWHSDIRADPFIKPMAADAPPDAMPRAIEVWGELRPEHLPAEGIMRIARSALNTLAKQYSGGASAINETLRKGMQALDLISSRPVSKAYLEALGRTVPAAAGQGAGAKLTDAFYEDRFARSNAQKVWKSEMSTGSFALPDLSGDPELRKSELVGFTNFPGLLAVREAVMQGGAVRKGYNKETLQALANLATLIENIAQTAKQLFPHSIFLDARYTPAQYPKAMSEVVLMDNLLGYYQEALFMPTNLGADVPDKIDRRILMEDRDNFKLIENLRANYQGAIIELFAYSSLAADSQNSVTIKYPLPKSADKAQATPFRKLALRQAMMELASKLAYAKKGTEDGITNFLKIMKGDNIGKIFEEASKNYKIFNVSSKEQLNTLLDRLEGDVAAATKQDKDLAVSGKTYGEYVYGGKGNDPQPIGASVYDREAPAAGKDIYYRTPLTLSAQQILQLARDPSLPARVAKSGTNASYAGSAQDMREIGQRVLQSQKADRTTVVPTYSSYSLSRDLGYFPSMYIAQSIMGEQQGASEDAVVLGAQQRHELRQARHERRQARGTRGNKRRLVRGAAADGSDSLSLMPGDGGTGGYGAGERALSSVEDTFVAQFRAADDVAADQAASLLAKILLGTPATRQSLEAMLKHNVVLPVVFVAARPHMRYMMRMGIKLRPGSETGNMYLGKSWWYLQDDTQKQVHKGIYRLWFKAVVREDKNVALAYDIFSADTLGGAGVKPIDLDRYAPHRGAYGQEGDSLLFVTLPYVCGYADGPYALPSDLDLSGRFLHFRLQQNNNTMELERLQYPTAARHNGELGWRLDADRASVDIHDTSNPFRHQNETPAINSTCCRGFVQRWNRNTMRYDLAERNTGHWGQLTVPGVRDIRRGLLKDYDGVMTSMYTAAA